MTEPEWVQHAIWWHVYPLGFVGADPTGTDRGPTRGLDQLVTWLDYAVELGVNGLLLGPIFTASSHGYDTSDYFGIDPRLGDESSFGRLTTAARERGLRVVLDGVFNHVGREFPGVAEAEHGQGERAGWFARSADGALATFEGHHGLVALDHGNAEVAEFVASVLRHWLAAGVDGWRLDAAYAVPPEFWTAVLPVVRSEYPAAYFVGEMLHGDYATYVRRSGLDAVTQYELWKAVWSALDSLNLFELDWALQRHNGFLDAFVPFTFIGNHDVTRLASQIGDERHRPHALVLLMLLGGTPAIYYGDEQGLLGVKEDRVGGDDAVRPAFPPSPVERSGSATETFRLHQGLIGLRRRFPWLHSARSQTVMLRNETLVLRVASGEDSLIVALNLADAAFAVEAGPAEVVGGAAEPVDGGWSVPAHGWAVLG